MNTAEGMPEINYEGGVEDGSSEAVTPDEPWNAERTQLYPEDDVRVLMQERITEVLKEHRGHLGILASELCPEVARRHFEETGEVVFVTGDVRLEASRMLGTYIRMAPNRRLFPKVPPKRTNR